MIVRGFTLIELLAATALTALLMVGVLNVVARLGADDLQSPKTPMGDAATALVERDLRLAREIRTGEGFVELRGYGYLDDESLALSHLPVLVRYETRTIGDEPWLIRVQTNLDQLTNDRPFIELVEACVQSLKVEFRPQHSPGTQAPATGAAAAVQRTPAPESALEAAPPREWTAVVGEVTVRLVRTISTEEGEE